MNSPWQSTFQVNAVESNGWTPLHVAVRREFVPIIRCSAKRMFEACGWMCLCRHIMMSYSYVYIMFLWMSYIIWIYSIHTLHIYICTAATSKDSLCQQKNWGYLLNARADANIADRIWARWFTVGKNDRLNAENWKLWGLISGDLWWFLVICDDLCP